jgi:hypothetical protein
VTPMSSLGLHSFMGLGTKNATAPRPGGTAPATTAAPRASAVWWAERGPSTKDEGQGQAMGGQVPLEEEDTAAARRRSCRLEARTWLWVTPAGGATL